MSPEFVDDELEPDPVLNRITNAIIGAAIAVHSKLGPGYQEHFYGNALEVEFKRRGIRYIREYRFDVVYEGVAVGSGAIDFLLEDEIVLELKAVESITPLFVSQVISYLKATNKRLGIILNFNVKALKNGIRRIAK